MNQSINCTRILRGHMRPKKLDISWLLELVSESAHGRNHVRLPKLAQFTPQVSNIDIDHIREVIGINVPHMFRNHFPAQYLLGMAQQGTHTRLKLTKSKRLG